MPEQKRVKATSTVVLPCDPKASVELHDATADYFPARLRRRRATWAAPRGSRVDGVTRQELRHNRRARRHRARETGDGWRHEWRRDDDPIDTSVSGRFSVDERDHSLTIRNVSSATDTAVYSCLRRRRSHGNTANSSTSDDVITSRQIQLVVQGCRSALRWHFQLVIFTTPL